MKKISIVIFLVAFAVSITGFAGTKFPYPKEIKKQNIYIKMVEMKKSQGLFLEMYKINQDLCKKINQNNCPNFSKKDFYMVLSRSPVLAHDMVLYGLKTAAQNYASFEDWQQGWLLNKYDYIKDAAGDDATDTEFTLADEVIDGLGLKDIKEYANLIYFGDYINAKSFGLSYQVFLNKKVKGMIIPKWKEAEEWLAAMTGDEEGVGAGPGDSSGGDMPSYKNEGSSDVGSCLMNIKGGGVGGVMGGKGGGGDPLMMPVDGGFGGGGFGFDDKPAMGGSGASGGNGANTCLFIDADLGGDVTNPGDDIEKENKEKVSELKKGDVIWMKKNGKKGDDGPIETKTKVYINGVGMAEDGTKTYDVHVYESSTVAYVPKEGDNIGVKITSGTIPGNKHDKKMTLDELTKLIADSEKSGYNVAYYDENYTDKYPPKKKGGKKKFDPEGDSSGGCENHAMDVYNCITGSSDDDGNPACDLADESNWAKMKDPNSHFSACSGGGGAWYFVDETMWFTDPNPVELNTQTNSISNFGASFVKTQGSFKEMPRDGL